MRYCLGDMSRIAGETEKLISYALQDKKITAEDVDLVVYRDAEYKTYEMSNALGLKNYGKFISVQEELLAKGMDEIAVLNSLAAYFRSLYEIVLIRKSDAETAKILGMKEYAVKMSRRQADSLGAKRVKECFLCASDALNAIKSGELTAPAALLSVNAQLFFGNQANIGRE